MLTIAIFVGVLLILVWARTSRYRLTRQSVIKLLCLVLEGKATEHDWRLFSALPLRHNPALDAVRERCLVIEEREYIGRNRDGFLFSPNGLLELQEILKELRAAEF
jgi:hypothetical protein